MDQDQLNKEMKKFLIDSREKAGMSQRDVAARSEVFGFGKTLDQRAVSRVEDQPISVDAIKIAGYLSAVGIQPEKYYELLRVYSCNNNKDGEVMSKLSRETISEKIKTTAEKLNIVKNKLLESNFQYVDTDNLIEKLGQLENTVHSLNRKPVIGCFGHFDAGKSTLINTIINESVLPTNYQPATCIVNLLMHTRDKPSTLYGNIAVFKKGFKLHMIHSEQAVLEYLIEQGSNEILEKFGKHNNEADVTNDAYIALIFADAEILNTVWLLDTPGDLNNTDDSDTEKALSGVELTDGIVFVSNHTGFFKATDLGFASNIIRQKPPVDKNHILEHLLFIQSHCHSEIKKEDVLSAGRTAIKRVKKQLDNLVFNSWMEDDSLTNPPTAEALMNRVQPFWRENEEYRCETILKISDMAIFLTNNHEMIVDKYLFDVLKNAASTINGSIEDLKQKKISSIERIEEVEKQDARFREQSARLNSDFNEIINSCHDRKKSDLETMHDYFQYITSQDCLEELINDTYSDKKDAQADIGNYIGQLLTAKLERVLKTSGRAISFEIDKLLTRWQEAVPAIYRETIDEPLGNFDLNITAFNSRAAFVGGLAGLSSLGAMALYVSTIASNLGAYIIVGKAAGVLVSLGLVGSVTTVTSFVAAIGGPITIGIALAAAIGYIVYRLSGGTWQKSLAKKVADAIHKEDIFDKIVEAINIFWDNTSKSIQAGHDELNSKTEEYVSKLKSDAKTHYDEVILDKCILELHAVLYHLK